jgi:hypothetical protein
MTSLVRAFCTVDTSEDMTTQNKRSATQVSPSCRNGCMIKIFVTLCLSVEARACVVKDAVRRKTDRSQHPQAELIR